MELNHFILISVVFWLLSSTRASPPRIALHPDADLNVVQMINKYGYPFENHTAITEDGYILELHRIPHGRNNNKNGIKKGAVLMMPALLCDSSEWVLTGPNHSFAFSLADNGYDVWLGNIRGTTWSRKHVKFDPDVDGKEFWDFSLDDIAYHDIPTFIDYILRITGQKKLFYIGHSQGTSFFFISMARRPEYNTKIRLMAAISLAYYVNHAEGLITPVIGSNIDLLEPFVEDTASYEILNHDPFLPTLSKLLCSDSSIFRSACLLILYHIVGFSNDQLDPSLIPVIVNNIPAGASYKQLQHLGQFYKTGMPRQFDYGKKGNLMKYGQETPPQYDLKKVTAPVAVFYGEEDYVIPHRDVKHAIDELSNVVVKKLVKGFNHLDLVWGRNAPALVFDPILKLMAEY